MHVVQQSQFCTFQLLTVRTILVSIIPYVLSGHANDRNTKKNSGSGPGTVSGIGSTSSGSSTSTLCKQRQSAEDGSCRVGTGVGVGLYGDRSNICVDIEAERVESHQSVLYRNRDKNKDREEGGEGHDGDDIESENGDGDGNEVEDGDEDGDGGGRGVVVIAATNRLEDLDPAVVRRFESKVYVGVPEHDTRVAMIVTFLRYPGRDFVDFILLM